MESNKDKKITDGMNYGERLLKRLCDLLGAMVLIIILSPVFLIIVVLQKILNPGPALYSQERIGRGGKPFKIYKFRTMVVDAEKDGIPQLEADNDTRLTDFGRMLRRHHVDELPQLWNVLKGDMSFVGYRPERQYFINQIMEHNPNYGLLFCSRPGVTSLATIENGYTDTMEKMLRRLDMDLEYFQTRTLWMDLKIILRTVFSL
ncbi:MAG: sugar transferase [Bacteroidaceae bacterium]|nr:sugar transferase [Bacteroidaceae bacterium]